MLTNAGTGQRIVESANMKARLKFKTWLKQEVIGFLNVVEASHFICFTQDYQERMNVLEKMLENANKRQADDQELLRRFEKEVSDLYQIIHGMGDILGLESYLVEVPDPKFAVVKQMTMQVIKVRKKKK